MSRKQGILVATIALLSFTAIGLAQIVAEPGKNSPSQDRPFTGKAVLINGQIGGASIEEPQLRSLGNRTYVVGRQIGSDPRPLVWYPVERIESIWEFADVVELKKVLGGKTP